MNDKPTSLYKFYSFSLLSLKTVSNDLLWFSLPSSFNDPYDCAIAVNNKKQDYLNAITETINSSNPREELARKWIGDKKELDEKYRKINDQLKKIGICCFTSDPKNMGMWSHYGGQHKGFCIEFDCSEGTELRRVVQEVKYSDTRVSINDYYKNYDKDINIEAFSDSWLVKSLSWIQEKEWRVMKPEGGREYPNLSSVKSIIFGARMKNDDRELLKKCMRHKQRIKFKNASLVDESFLIEIHDYGPSFM